MRQHPLTLALVFAAALAYGFLFVNGTAATLGFLLVGILGGFALRSWRALPILALGILLGGSPASSTARAGSARSPRRRPSHPPARQRNLRPPARLRPPDPLLAFPVALGIRLGTPRRPHTLANWRK
jgi:hypothetical protein